MRGRQIVLSIGVIGLTACSFRPGTATDGDDDPLDAPPGDADPTLPDAIPDAPPGAPDAALITVDHLPPGSDTMLISNVDWTIAIDTHIDTDGGAMRIVPPPPPGVVIHEAMVMIDTREAFVVQARNITVASGVALNVDGGRPVILVATFGFVIENGATIDGSADRRTPGPGGSGSSGGDGDGGNGERGSSEADCGGGGGGFGGDGGNGGDCNGGDGGDGGGTYANASVLIGGSGGGNASPSICGVQGGAGGGAIQLTAGQTLTIEGTIHVGGGGGDPGFDCDLSLNDEDGTSGAGGGAGGMIYLQATTILGDGALGANGGGGGEAGASSSFGTADAGDDANTLTGGSGGSGDFSSGGDGGNGANGTNTGASGESKTSSNENGGGGGGGTGVIYRKGDAGGASMQCSPPWIAVP